VKEGIMRRELGKKETIRVKVSVDHSKIVFDPCCLHVLPEDTIVWQLDGERAFAIIVKDFMSPLEWGIKVADKGAKEIKSKVVLDAEYGLFSYTICAVDRDKLLVADPEIIVHPPNGGRS
jgi:plastocyanin